MHLSNYHNLVKKIDQFCQKIADRYPESIACKKGCSNCCSHISVFPVEALALNMAMKSLSSEIQGKIRLRAKSATRNGECPLMENGACLMYIYRPVICRTHGLPILVKTESGVSLDYCPLNFTGEKEPEKAFTLDLEQLNTLLSTVNDLFLKDTVFLESLPERILISQAILMECQPD